MRGYSDPSRHGANFRHCQAVGRGTILPVSTLERPHAAVSLMTRNRNVLLALSLGLALASPLVLLAGAGDGSVLASAPTPAQATTSRLVYGLLSDSRYAYRPRALDDALSKEILKRYLDALDPGQSVTVTWTDAGGGVRSASVTLGSSPVN